MSNSGAQILGGGFQRELAIFLLGYFVILVTPGPNLLVIGSIAALRGVRGALPLCLGVSLGAAALSAVLLAAVRVAPAGAWYLAIRVGAALLLLWLALKIASKKSPATTPELSAGAAFAEFGAGFFTAATNPVTIGYFTAHFLGPLSLGGRLRATVPLSVMTEALLFWLAISSALAIPSVRRATLRWHRPICLSAALVLVFTAAMTLRELLSLAQGEGG